MIAWRNSSPNGFGDLIASMQWDKLKSSSQKRINIWMTIWKLFHYVSSDWIWLPYSYPQDHTITECHRQALKSCTSSKTLLSSIRHFPLQSVTFLFNPRLSSLIGHFRFERCSRLNDFGLIRSCLQSHHMSCLFSRSHQDCNVTKVHQDCIFDLWQAQKCSLDPG
jgi:hypothetical protein